MTFDEIIEMTRLMYRVDEAPDNADLVQEYQQMLERRSPDDIKPMLAAKSLMVGRGYTATSDNPKSHERLLAFAEYIGAQIHKLDDEGFSIGLAPPHYDPESTRDTMKKYVEAMGLNRFQLPEDEDPHYALKERMKLWGLDRA